MTKADKFTTVRLVFAPIFLIIYILPEWFPASGFITGCILLPLLCFAEFTDFCDRFLLKGSFVNESYEIIWMAPASPMLPTDYDKYTQKCLDAISMRNVLIMNNLANKSGILM